MFANEIALTVMIIHWIQVVKRLYVGGPFMTLLIALYSVSFFERLYIYDQSQRRPLRYLYLLKYIRVS